MPIGVPQSDYNTVRNIVQSMPNWAIRVRPVDPYRVRSAIRERVSGRLKFSEHFRFSEPYLPRADLLHFFNRVACCRTPWMCTFETSLPRWGEVDDHALRVGTELLLSESCRRLLALSQAALDIASADWEQVLGGTGRAQLLEKAEVLLPPQRVLAGPERTSPDVPRRFTFVGGDLFRKGGLQLLEALDRLRQRGVHGWHATIVGRLDSFGDYASATTRDDMLRAGELLARLHGCVDHFPRASNETVISLLRDAHYFVFPTLADTFGYSVLEAQACGAVVISTNVRALPEINSDEQGFVVRLPLNERRECHGRPDFAKVKQELSEQLESAILRALELPEQERQRMAAVAIQGLRRAHDPMRHAEIVASRYVQALRAT